MGMETLECISFANINENGTPYLNLQAECLLWLKLTPNCWSSANILCDILHILQSHWIVSVEAGALLLMDTGQCQTNCYCELGRQ